MDGLNAREGSGVFSTGDFRMCQKFDGIVVSMPVRALGSFPLGNTGRGRFI